MSNQLSTQTISFYGSELITLKLDDVIYTAVKPVADALGINWATQTRKLENSKEKFNCCHMTTVAKDGKLREMLCMPLKKLNGWLFSINPEKVRPDLKEKVIRYQEECFEALYNYWHFGKAERKTTVDERTGLRDAVNMLVSKKGLIYSEAYNLVHQRFNVQSIEDLTREQLPMAVEYVHKICLEGELIMQDPNKPHPDEITVPYNLFQALYHHGRRGQRLGHQVNMLFQILRLDLSQARFIAVGLAHDCVTESSTWLDKAEDIICKRQMALQIM